MTFNRTVRSTVSLLGGVLLSTHAFAQAQESFHVMTYNVENLFDATHDEGKNDYTYLPREVKDQDPEIQKFCGAIQDGGWREECLKLDWSEDAISKKLANIAQVILNDNGGKGPDVIVLPEVENVSILERLRTEYLSSAGYEHAVLLEGKDERGIDVGIISRLPLEGQPQIHAIPLRGPAASTRGIMEARLKLTSGKTVTVLGVHFPSPHNPTEERAAALKFLGEVAQQKAQESDVVVAAGDFNITRDEQNLLKDVEKQWAISHFVGCQSCEGTNYFKKGNSWSFLDVIMVYKSASSTESDTGAKWGFDSESIRVCNDLDLQKTRDGKPDGFDVRTHEGVSDHFPLTGNIQLAL